MDKSWSEPTITEENFSSFRDLDSIILKCDDLLESSSFPSKRVFGLAVGTVMKPKVHAPSEVAREQKIVFFAKFSSTKLEESINSSLIGIAIMFGVGNAFDSVVSLGAYIFMRRRMKNENG